MKMQFEVSHSLRVRPGGTKSFVSMSILLLVACAAFVPCAPVVAAENGRVQAAPAGDERPADRRRWWLNIWAHFHAGNLLYHLDGYAVRRSNLAMGVARPTSEFHLCVVDRCGVGAAQREMTGGGARK